VRAGLRPPASRQGHGRQRRVARLGGMNTVDPLNSVFRREAGDSGPGWVMVDPHNLVDWARPASIVIRPRTERRGDSADGRRARSVRAAHRSHREVVPRWIRALHGVSFGVGAARSRPPRWAGSGKSTLLKILAGCTDDGRGTWSSGLARSGRPDDSRLRPPRQAAFRAGARASSSAVGPCAENVAIAWGSTRPGQAGSTGAACVGE
jgi:hypothetical protein